MKHRNGFTLIELMIVIAIIAIIAAIAIPGLLAARKASNERNASASLKAVVTAEENFRSNDLDRNQVGDFWTGNLAGLYCLQFTATGNAVAALNDIGAASADVDFINAAAAGYGNASVTYNPALLLTASPKTGYAYQALTMDAVGAFYAVDTDGSGSAVHNFGKYGFVAVPIDWDSTGNHVYVVNEGAQIFRKDFGTATAVPAFGTPMATYDGTFPLMYPPAPILSTEFEKVE